MPSKRKFNPDHWMNQPGNEEKAAKFREKMSRVSKAAHKRMAAGLPPEGPTRARRRKKAAPTGPALEPKPGFQDGVHWTQTPEGRAKRSAAQRKAAERRRAERETRDNTVFAGILAPARRPYKRRAAGATGNGDGSTQTLHQEPQYHAQQARAFRPDEERPVPHVIPDGIFAYALGRIESWIETYAQGAGVPQELLAAKLGEVLRGKGRR